MAIAMQYGSGDYGSNSRIAKSVIYKGTINDGSTVTLTLDAGGLFEIFTAEYNATTYAYRGHRARLVKMPEESLYGTVAAATVNEAASTNSGVTITMNADSTISIARSSSTYAVKYIVRSVDVYTGNVVSVNVSGGGGGGGTGTLTQITFDGTVYTDDGTGNVTLAESDPVFAASDAYGITSTDISNWNAKVDSGDLAAVATSGDYDDLLDKPAIHNIPSGGTTGQVLAKSSSTDYDVGWVNQSGGGGSKAILTATILAADWSGSAPYTNAVTVTGLLATDTPVMDLVASSIYATAQNEISDYGNIYKAVCADNTLTVYATSAPTHDLNIQLLCVR